MKKINLSIISYAGLSYGGAHRQVIRLACALDKKIFNVRFFWCEHNKDYGSSFVFPELDYENIGLLRKHGVEVIEFHVAARDIRRPFHPWLGTDFWEVYNTYPTDLVFAAKAGYPEYPFVLIREPIIEWNVFACLDRSKNVVCSVSQSDWVRKIWLKAGGAPEMNRLIYPYVPDVGAMDDMRNELGILKDEVVVGFHQRQDDFIFGEQALRAYSNALVEVKKKTRFVILGGSHKYRELATSLGVDVIFLPIAKDYQYVSRFLNTLDIFAHSGGAGETLCIAIQEAMMHALPVITMVLPDKPDAQVDTLRDSGVITYSVQEYSDMLHNLIEDPTLRTMYAEKAKDVAVRYYSEKSCIREFTQLFEELHVRYRGKRFAKFNRNYFVLFFPWASRPISIFTAVSAKIFRKLRFL